MLISLELQRTVKRADILALDTALCKLCRPSGIFFDNRGVVKGLNTGEVDCISTGQKDADLWVQVAFRFRGSRGTQTHQCTRYEELVR